MNLVEKNVGTPASNSGQNPEKEKKHDIGLVLSSSNVLM
jgi:hypothetical protein